MSRSMLHASAAAVALLPPPELAIDEFMVDGKPGWHAREQRDQRLAVRLTGCGEAQHGNGDCSRCRMEGGNPAGGVHSRAKRGSSRLRFRDSTSFAFRRRVLASRLLHN